MTDNPFKNFGERVNPLKSDAKNVKEFHTKDDVDSSADAHHHTLGLGINQAAPGSYVKQIRADLDALIEGGGSGGGSSGITQVFAVATNPWVITHNFAVSQVLVTCYDSDGEEIKGDVEYLDNTKVQITWFAATTGSCRVAR